MFLIRCIFWLSVVYASMTWGGGALRSHGSFEAATTGGEAFVQAVAAQAINGAASYCKGQEELCVKQAAQMTALVETTLKSEPADDSIVQDAVDAPLPIPDPRRRVASSVLTRVR